MRRYSRELTVALAYVLLLLLLAVVAPTFYQGDKLLTILVGNTIVLIPILLNSHAGTKYGIPFPVFARASYGTIGSNLPALMRAIVACGWFGIQAWIGGEALHTFFTSILPSWPATPSSSFPFCSTRTQGRSTASPFRSSPGRATGRSDRICRR